jgi:hypothetical protein
MSEMKLTQREAAPTSVPEIRQAVRKAVATIFDTGMYGSNAPAPRGTLRGIDVLGIDVVRQKLSRTALIAHGAYGTVADFTQPKGYFEKLAIAKLFAPIPMPSPADKLTVEAFIPPDLKSTVRAVPNVWQSPLVFDAEKANKLDLPKGKYYLKANNGSGSVRPIELPVAQEDGPKLASLTKKWLNVRHGERAGEWWYSLIGPRIFLEKDLRTGDSPIADWKFHVGGGRLLAVQLDEGRGVDHQQYLFDENFNRLNMDLFFSGRGEVDKPDNLQKMCAAAVQIGCQFEYARVDFYNYEGQIFLGEVTLAPMGGLKAPKSEELNGYLGQRWGDAFISN